MKNHYFLVIMLLFSSFKMTAQEKNITRPKGTAESNELKVEEKWRDKDFLVNISEPRMIAFSC